MPVFQSTHPMRGATRRRHQRCLGREISIHAPHAGCERNFNPRTPCGVRRAGRRRPARAATFQSTHPMRGATVSCAVNVTLQRISIHAPHAGCDPRIQLHSAGKRISIHAPHAGCDKVLDELFRRKPEFQSTHPMRGATGRNGTLQQNERISIHAPHAGCDDTESGVALTPTISIHAPHAGCDHHQQRQRRHRDKFQSTHPMRGATGEETSTCSRCQISIHAPHAGCDLGAVVARRAR